MRKFYHHRNYQLQKYTASDFPQLWDLLTSSFPKEELFAKDVMADRLEDIQSETWLLKYQQDKLALALITRKIQDFYFFEYLAVSPALRGQGLGGAFMRHIRKALKKPILFESELPQNPVAKKRLKFHQSCGFRILDLPYEMPAVRPDSDPIPMHVLASMPPEITQEIGEAEIQNAIEDVYTEVYADVIDLPQNQELLNNPD
ncbi:MAG: GNAT family N-acetyltransferase [Eubacteriales bacterium]|nr:GNAT family N-acetyltransferase [Clostridiales bacterium]MDY5837029.1 GNAT family N-acetyltransferase [Eubacteriales bacterium]